MFSDDFHEKFDRFTLGIIRRKVKQLITRAGFTLQDREDLEQELFGRVLQSLPSFDASLAHRNRFITRLVQIECHSQFGSWRAWLCRDFPSH